MSGVLRAEFRRISTTKLWWIVLICIFVLSAGYAALPAAVALMQSRAGIASSPFLIQASCTAFTTAEMCCLGSWPWWWASSE